MQRSNLCFLSKRQFWIYTLKVFICLVLVMVVLGPLLITLFTSFKTRGHMATVSPLALPPLNEMTLENYKAVFDSKLIGFAFRNTLVIVVVSLFFNVIFGSITAYCLERFNFRFKSLIISLFLAGTMVPSFIIEITRFKVVQSLGLYNTIWASIIIYVAADLMQLYIYRQFIRTVPVSIEESALIDGCGQFRIFWQIVFPQLAPATATVIIVKATTIINDMYIPYLYMPKNQLKTLTTFLLSYASNQQGSWQVLSAAIVVVLIPTLLIYLFFQKYIFAGLTVGAVKE